ncbi:MAG: hypothetical protein IPF47_18960 [Gemmatimonadetes bacterium]|nr:hypothetical protein [Gemmatimonadota bacterium]
MPTTDTVTALVVAAAGIVAGAKAPVMPACALSRVRSTGPANGAVRARVTVSVPVCPWVMGRLAGATVMATLPVGGGGALPSSPHAAIANVASVASTVGVSRSRRDNERGASERMRGVTCGTVLPKCGWQHDTVRREE